jgi:carbon starvation protein
VWILLQSRGYLGGFILYATFAVGVIGLLFGKHAIQFPTMILAIHPASPPNSIQSNIFIVLDCLILFNFFLLYFT